MVGLSRVYVRMWLADSSGLHAGRQVPARGEGVAGLTAAGRAAQGRGRDPTPSTHHHVGRLSFRCSPLISPTSLFAQAVWSPSEAHVELSGPRPGGWVGPKRSGGGHSSGGKQQREPEAGALSDRRACVWNSARQLGRSHWESDTVLHVEVRRVVAQRRAALDASSVT